MEYLLFKLIPLQHRWGITNKQLKDIVSNELFIKYYKEFKNHERLINNINDIVEINPSLKSLKKLLAEI